MLNLKECGAGILERLFGDVYSHECMVELSNRLDEANTTLRHSMEKKNNVIHEQRAANNDLIAEVDSLNIRLELCKDTLVERDNAITSLTENGIELSRKVEELENTIINKDESIAELMSENSDCKSRLEIAIDLNDSMSDEIRGLQAEVRELLSYKEKVNELERLMTETKKRYEDELVAMEDKSKHALARFTCTEIRKIRELAANGRHAVDIANDYSVARTTILRIITRKTYKDC